MDEDEKKDLYQKYLNSVRGVQNQPVQVGSFTPNDSTYPQMMQWMQNTAGDLPPKINPTFTPAPTPTMQTQQQVQQPTNEMQKYTTTTVPGITLPPEYTNAEQSLEQKREGTIQSGSQIMQNQAQELAANNQNKYDQLQLLQEHEEIKQQQQQEAQDKLFNKIQDDIAELRSAKVDPNKYWKDMRTRWQHLVSHRIGFVHVSDLE